MEKKQVYSKLPDGHIAFWERHPAHPHGEIFIADNKPQSVAMTSGVVARVKSGVLAVVEEAEKQPEPEPKPKNKAKGKAEGDKGEE